MIQFGKMETESTFYCPYCDRDVIRSDRTDEHFIPRSLKAPKRQHFPICLGCNRNVNTRLDSPARALLRIANLSLRGSFSSEGEALMRNGSVVAVRFQCSDPIGGKPGYLRDVRLALDPLVELPNADVFAIKSHVGFSPDELGRVLI